MILLCWMVKDKDKKGQKSSYIFKYEWSNKYLFTIKSGFALNMNTHVHFWVHFKYGLALLIWNLQDNTVA
jgi:hypothetical protein